MKPPNSHRDEEAANRPQPGPLQIPQAIVTAMVAHCLQDAPLEACGLLGGVAPVVASFYPLRNVSRSETRYDADTRDLIEAVQALRGRGEEILALYHSHPQWAAVPSQTDLRENHYGDVPRIIVSLLGPEPEVRIWRLDPHSYEELPWDLIPESGRAEVERKSSDDYT
jgi:proteasome lid subunit RPN8/RPN11